MIEGGYMAEQVLIQFRADRELKREAAEICEDLGIDLPTVFRMCMKQIKLTRGIPFPTRLRDESVTRAEALRAFEALRSEAAALPELSLDEINAEIEAARSQRSQKSA